ncbi:MAG: hypothetical protein HYU66_15150 [Armatimonadetes bacterium]|nr:hypothetical protein [Armatimonadota bacterium]
MTPIARADDASRVGEVNTLWVIPEEHFAWVEPLNAKRHPGGGLYSIQGFVAQRDLGVSVRYAIEYLKRHPETCPGFIEAWRKHDLYFSWPDPDQPRGGPSAGLAFAIAAYSALCEIPVRADVAFTGTVEPDGRVLGVGGVEYKIPAAIAAGLRTVVIPADGGPDPDDLPVSIARTLRVVTIETAAEAFFEAYGLDGREKDRYDRVNTLWHQVTERMGRRERVGARLALDELVELVPHDLSARRLQSFYSGVDMTAAAADLFADAEKYERDGLPDEALRTAHRAWQYADGQTRDRYRELMARLERGSLPTELRTELDKAEDYARRGLVGDAWRMLQQLRPKAPGNPYVERYQVLWANYAEVARLEEDVAAQPNDAALLAGLARGLLDAGVAWRAADVYADLRRRQPEAVEWVMAEARARHAAGKPDQAAAILRESRARWPNESRETCLALGVEVEPPTLSVNPLEAAGRLAVSLIRTTDASGVPTVSVSLDGIPVASLADSPVRLWVDGGQLLAGVHTLKVAARDKFDNETAAALKLDVPPQDDGPCLRAGEPPAAPTAAGAWDLRPGAGVTLLRGTRLTVDGGGWFATPLRVVMAAEVQVGSAPFRLSLDTSRRAAGRWDVTVVPRPLGGAALPGVTVPVELVDAPPAWVVAPAAGAALDGTVRLVVGVREVLEGSRVVALVDEQPWAEGPGSASLRLNAERLPPGEHALRAVVKRPDGQVQVSPPVAVRVGERGSMATGPRPTERAPEAVVVPPTAAMLGAVAKEPAKAVRAEPAAGSVGLEAAAPTYAPAEQAAVVDTAIRLDTGKLPEPGRVMVAAGDAVALAEPFDRGPLGPAPELREGPLATVAWLPSQPGTYRLTLRSGQLALTVTPRPVLQILEPPSGVRLQRTTRLRLALPAALEVVSVTLADGDRALGTWPAPLPVIALDPLLMDSGWHALRVVALLADGTRVVSPAVVVRVD